MVLVLLPRQIYQSTIFQKQEGLCECKDDTGLLPGESLPEPALARTDLPADFSPQTLHVWLDDVFPRVAVCTI